MLLEDISDPILLEAEDSGYGHKLYFGYQKAKEMSKPNPIVLFLGVWRMTDKQGNRKKFLCGINLATLSSKEELSALQYYLPDILEPKDMKNRYRVGKMLLPDVFRKAYRTYNVKNVANRPVFGRLYALKTTDQDREDAQKEAQKDGLDWDTMSQRDKDQYLERSIRKRGEKDVSRKDRATKERDNMEDYLDYLQAQREKEEVEEPEPEEVTRAFEPEVEEMPKTMTPITPGPGIPIQSPLQSAETGMPTPQKIQIKPEKEKE